MTERIVYIDTIGTQTRRLVVEDGRPVELAYAYSDMKSLVGSIYLGRVVNIIKGMNAAFVDIGLDKNAFLSMTDIPPALRDAGMDGAARRKPLKGGQEILVQVTKEPGGDKGPRVSMNLTFAGDYAVLLPTMAAVGVSRHIEDEAQRARLYDLGARVCPQGMGLILRTASADAPEEDIALEVSALRAQWDAIAAAAITRPAPSLMHDEADLLQQARRDLRAEPCIGPFDARHEGWLEKNLRRKVWLDSGAYLVFDTCEAMTVIDVNSGKNTGRKSLEDSLLRLNLEAAHEAALQIRLRDVGGIIVIDFVDMRSEEDRQAVLDSFRQAMREDRSKHHIYGFTGTGLLEMTRRPLYQPLRDAQKVLCPRCHGEGAVTSPRAAAHTLLRDVRARRAAGQEGTITLTTSGEIAGILKAIGLPPGTRLVEGEAY